MERLLGSLLCLLQFVFFVASEQTLCLNGKAVASLDASHRVTLMNEQGELLKSQGGQCYCQEAADQQVYLACEENQWPTIAQQPPDRPMMCAKGRSDEGKAVCPTGYSPAFLNLVKGYDLVAANRGTQQVSVCDKKTFTKVGSMEADLFRRSSGVDNTLYADVKGCSCQAGSDKQLQFKCKPWPTSLSVSYQENDPNLICVNGISCPKPR
ncbi:hypothetical protein PGT21_035962 [Puccinia graminis f. sp. tritici]|uniref:Cyanovirin-N domain-containing protein n=1 Tax=Puccinia graminis f. sp. tritici TaxID=56615 RepID=A0A5B0QDM8_PUCGR|nr:hypothetical protein PGT21_035962 [Puccinia graminis f. sp. tritici]